MIGLSALLPKLFFALVGTSFAVAIVRSWTRVIRKREPFTAKLVFITLFVALWAGLLTQLFVREAMFHHRVATLQPVAVQSITIGTQTIKDPETISAIVTSMNDVRWFSVNHGGWAQEVPFNIQLKSGVPLRYRIGRYLRQEGAVLSSSSKESGGWSNGYLFCPTLVQVLTQKGVSLPGPQPSSPPPPKPEGESPSSPGPWRLVPIIIFGFFTLVAITGYYQLVTAKAPPRDPDARLQQVSNSIVVIFALPFVSLFIAFFGPFVSDALFDWPDSSNRKMTFVLWLILVIVGFFIRKMRSAEKVDASRPS